MAEIDICMYKLTKAGFSPGKNLGRGVSVGWADFMIILIILVITLSKHEYIPLIERTNKKISILKNMFSGKGRQSFIYKNYENSFKKMLISCVNWIMCCI